MRLACIALVSIVTLLSGCSTAVEGSAVKGEKAPPPPKVDVSKLDVGPYPAEPSAPLGVAGNPMRGAVIEAQRMANIVVGPWEVDSALTKWFGLGAMVLKSPDALTLIGPEQFAPAEGAHDFIY